MNDDFKKLQEKTNDKDLALLIQLVAFYVSDYGKRIERLEKAALWVMGTVFGLVLVAVVGLVITKGNQ